MFNSASKPFNTVKKIFVEDQIEPYIWIEFTKFMN